MQDETVLSERQKMILKAIVDSHIESGEPIGSKLLSGRLSVSLSSASIRNVMAELEKLGADGTIEELAKKYGVETTAIKDFSDQK